MITTVTITGADEKVNPLDLVKIGVEYPFVEWGILLSADRPRPSRYPNVKWYYHLEKLKSKLNLSLHICGKYSRWIAEGSSQVVEDLGDYWNLFKRVQINTRGIKFEQIGNFIEFVKAHPNKEFILQYNEMNHDAILAGDVSRSKVSCLFDGSGGRGKLPKGWPSPIVPRIKTGYAGGLTPENLIEQLVYIEEAAKRAPYWIDVESGVRTAQDDFDLEKVKKFLSIAKKYIHDS